MIGKCFLSGTVAAILHATGMLSAVAVPINFSTTGFGPITYFSGTVQESVLNFTGCPGSFNCDGSMDLTVDVPHEEVTHGVSFNVGTNDGSFPGPDETYVIMTTYNVGGESVTLEQEARFRQIGNDQFQFDLSTSDTKSIGLGGLDVLNVRANSFAGQVPSGFGGSGILRSTFELTQIPEPATLFLATGGLLWLTWRRPHLATTLSRRRPVSTPSLMSVHS